MRLATPEKIRNLQRALYLRAKESPRLRFYSLYDKVSQVNEFLQQLESFRGVVACTTNLFKELDQASLRRFVFKVEFRYMRPEQAVRLFRAVFAELVDGGVDDAAVAAELKRVPPLAPGDFAAVRRQLVVRVATGSTVGAVCRALSVEAGVRKAPGTIGFT